MGMKKVLAIDADINVHPRIKPKYETKYLGDDFEEFQNI